jgi:hypothetical protein
MRAFGIVASIRSPRPAASTIATAPSTAPRLLEVREHHPAGRGLDDVADDDRRVMYPAAANSVTKNQADELDPERIGAQAVRTR